jgi:hypothetical protein
MALSLPLPLRHSFTSIPSQPSSPHSPQLCHINPTFSSLTTLPFRNQPAYYDLPPYSHRFYSAVRFTFTLWTLTRAGQLRPLPAPAPVLHTRLRLQLWLQLQLRLLLLFQNCIFFLGFYFNGFSRFSSKNKCEKNNRNEKK